MFVVLEFQESTAFESPTLNTTTAQRLLLADSQEIVCW